MGTYSLEDVARAAGDPGQLMFQLYVLKDRNFTRDIVQVRASRTSQTSLAASFCCLPLLTSLLRRGHAFPSLPLAHRAVDDGQPAVPSLQRAERAGYGALAVTVDAPRSDRQDRSPLVLRPLWCGL